jgi:hypothetical protein
MNPAPASTDDYKQLRKERLEKLAGDVDRLKAVSASAAYKEGDPDAVRRLTIASILSRLWRDRRISKRSFQGGGRASPKRAFSRREQSRAG